MPEEEHEDEKGGRGAADRMAEQAKEDTASEGKDAGVDPDEEGGTGDAA